MQTEPWGNTPTGVPAPPAIADGRALSGDEGDSMAFDDEGETGPDHAPADRLAAPRPVALQTGGPPPALPPPRRRIWPRMLALLLLVLVAFAGALVYELRNSPLQAHYLSRLTREIDYAIETGADPQPLPPDAGPYDLRLGYARLPALTQRLNDAGFTIDRQARPSARMRALAARGLYRIYHEKDQAGLTVVDAGSDVVHAALYPTRIYPGFDAVPPLAAQSLLFVEDRALLHAGRPYRNPVFNWDRMAKATWLRLLSDEWVIGASTLATQLEKVRHSPEGVTTGAHEKLIQMASASLRSYLDGEDTRPVRRRLLIDYLNSLPLAARKGYGEVWGLGDGLQIWYASDLAEVNHLLLTAHTDPAAAALAYKQVLSLILAARRPSYYLSNPPVALDAFTNSYLRVLAAEGVIDGALRDAALSRPLHFADAGAVARAANGFVERKGVHLVRARLQTLLGLRSLYDLDRLDLTAHATLHTGSQITATRLLHSLGDPQIDSALGLTGEHLLGHGDAAKVIYSVALYERGEDGNRLRVSADNLDQPFDINSGSRMDLGSTAKLRTLITWLEETASTYTRYAALTPEALAATQAHERDTLGAWVLEYLRAHPDGDVHAMLEAAMQRRFSASPKSSFYTGGAPHHFNNFDAHDDGRVLTVSEAFQRSVNLVFIRIMKELVDHLLYADPESAARLALEVEDPALREDYLRRFADSEGRQYVRRFYAKYAGQDADTALATMLQGTHATPRRVSIVLRSVQPEATPETLASLVQRYVPASTVSTAAVNKLYAQYARERYSLVDRAYLARVHPLELWVLSFLRAHPGARADDALAASASERQEVYRWLFTTRDRKAQDNRIRALLETEAFLEIHKRWQRLGYPFASLTPSLASAIGSSGDRPAALAELMGILVNAGIRKPTILIESLDFGVGTPYETHFSRHPTPGERVVSRDVAVVVRQALLDVVQSGTARALGPAMGRLQIDGLTIGGKTGTGDHRYEVYGPGGRLIESRPVNRAAVFAFQINDRYFGTVTAFVPGEDAGRYEFTSGLAVRVLGALLPGFMDLLKQPPGSDAANGNTANSNAGRCCLRDGVPQGICGAWSASCVSSGSCASGASCSCGCVSSSAVVRAFAGGGALSASAFNIQR